MTNGDLLSLVAILFTVHSVLIYAIIKLLVTGRAVWFVRKDAALPREEHV